MIDRQRAAIRARPALAVLTAEIGEPSPDTSQLRFNRPHCVAGLLYGVVVHPSAAPTHEPPPTVENTAAPPTFWTHPPRPPPAHVLGSEVKLYGLVDRFTPEIVVQTDAPPG